jgi:hypothetical protein
MFKVALSTIKPTNQPTNYRVILISRHLYFTVKTKENKEGKETKEKKKPPTCRNSLTNFIT